MTKMDQPIGIFDSGIGGMSVLKEIIQLMPEENYIYYGDSANAPYGTKTAEEIRQLSLNCMHFLLKKDAKAVVIACNTATSAAVAMLREMYPEIPIIGIEPALKPAVLWKEHDRIAVLATPMTLQQEKFQNLLHTYENDSDIYCIPCPGLMEFVERGELTGANLTAFLQDLLTPYLNKIDAIVLGCTHYPFVAPVIRKIAGPSIKIFHGGYGTAKELKRRLIETGIKKENSETGTVEIYNSNHSPETIALCEHLLHV